MTKKEDLIALYDGCEKHFDAKVIFMLIGDHFIVTKSLFYSGHDLDDAHRMYLPSL